MPCSPRLPLAPSVSRSCCCSQSPSSGCSSRSSSSSRSPPFCGSSSCSRHIRARSSSSRSPATWPNSGSCRGRSRTALRYNVRMVSEAAVLDALKAVRDPDLNRDIVSVKIIIAVGAGKGGVGKTTVAVNLAIALSQCGGRVAIIDGDIYGPNVPLMLGIQTQLTTDGEKIIPAEQYGIQLVSMAFLTGDDAPVIWRGPMLHGVSQQFFREVKWDAVDYLIVDMPPGTGDVA